MTPSDEKFYGAYKCVAKNVHGEDYHVIRLQEAHEPSDIIQSKLGVVTGNSEQYLILMKQFREKY